MPIKIVRVGGEVVLTRRDGQGGSLRVTVQEWRQFLAAVRLVDLDPDNLPGG